MRCHCGKNLSGLNEENSKRHETACGPRPISTVLHFFSKKCRFEEPISENNNDLEIVLSDPSASCTNVISTVVNREDEPGCSTYVHTESSEIGEIVSKHSLYQLI